MGRILASLLIISIVVVLLGYVGYSNNLSPIKPIIQQYVPSSIQQRFSTGDIMTLNLQPLGNSKTLVFGSNGSIPTNLPSNAIVTTNNGKVAKPVNVTSLDQSTLNVTEGKSFGQTSQFKETLPVDTFQLGNPIGISGTLQMVVPNTCLNLNGQITCQYVQPPIWNYLLIISCDIPQNTNCVMDDHSTRGMTDGAGNYNFTWFPSTNLNAGEYLVSIQASSLVKDPNGQEYVLTQNKLENLVR